MAEPMIKGGMLREFLSWYEGKHGIERMRWLARHLPDDVRRYVDPDEPLVSVLAASWYPARLTHAILDALAADRSEREVERDCREATRWIVERSMNGIYRFAFQRLITPEMYALSINRMWRQLHTTGTREIRITSKHTAESTVKSWAGHHAVLCTVTIELMCAVFERMGKKNVTWKRTACVSRGAKECVTRLEWA